MVVWLHSGDFTVGNATEMNPFHLVFKQKLLVVTVAYRLGIFGFFTSMDFAAPGNFGLMDQAAAMMWVNQHIKLFGGNEKSVRNFLSLSLVRREITYRTNLPNIPFIVDHNDGSWLWGNKCHLTFNIRCLVGKSISQGNHYVRNILKCDINS